MGITKAIWLPLLLSFYTQFACKNNSKTMNKVPECLTMADLKKHNGQMVTIQGDFEEMDPMRRKPPQILLKDSTWVILSFTSSDINPGPERQSELSGSTVIARGKIFTEEIPNKYGIISRLSSPYLLEIELLERQSGDLD